jgi:hypothetical protein
MRRPDAAAIKTKHCRRHAPAMDKVRLEARRPKIRLQILPTHKAIEVLIKKPEGTNAILHVAC